MDAAQVARIRLSFEAIAPRAHELVELFYDKLFANYPQVRMMFPADMSGQQKHLLSAIKLVVQNADRFETLREPLLAMGERHVGYGAKPEHYPIVRDTLLGALAEVAGNVWNEQLRRDWADALNAVAGVMLEGAQRAAPTAVHTGRA